MKMGGKTSKQIEEEKKYIEEWRNNIESTFKGYGKVFGVDIQQYRFLNHSNTAFVLSRTENTVYITSFIQQKDGRMVEEKQYKLESTLPKDFKIENTVQSQNILSLNTITYKRDKEGLYITEHRNTPHYLSDKMLKALRENVGDLFLFKQD